MDNPFIAGLKTIHKRKRNETDDSSDEESLSSIDECSVSEYDGSEDDSPRVVRRKKKKKKGPKITFQNTLLPADARARDKESEQEQRDEEKGFSNSSPCELCRLVDETAEVYPESLKEYYDYEKVQSKNVPPERLRKLLKTKFNSVCWELDQDFGGKANVQKMTITGIRKHKEETMALPRNVIELLNEQIDYFRKALHQIRFSEMWYDTFVDYEREGPVRMENSGSTKYARIWKLLKEAIELREKLLAKQEREGNGKTQALGMKGKASFKYLSFRPC
jgi:hypothetical protein